MPHYLCLTVYVSLPIWQLRKFMARWTKRQLSAAWNTLYEKMLDYRAQLEEMRKVLAFMRNRLLVQSWNKWREVYADRFDSMGGSCRCRCIADMLGGQLE